MHHAKQTEYHRQECKTRACNLQYSESECEHSEPKKNMNKQKTSSECVRLVPVAYNALSECERSEPKKNLANRKQTASV